MKIRNVKLKRYSIPLAGQLTLKTGNIKTRKGALLFLTDSNGNTACGELAPLETLHKESLDEAFEQLTQLKENLIGIYIPPAFTEFTQGIETALPLATFPSVTTAIEIAILNLFKDRGKFNDLENIEIPVNALLTANTDNICDSAKRLIAEGFTSIKVKVGRGNLDEEISVINELSKIVKEKATIRLDANRKWSLNTALEFCTETASPSIEYIEEPLSNINDIPEFTQKSKIPIALDETLVEKNIEQIKQIKNIAAFILKPSLLGGFKKTADLVRYAKQNKISAVISSAFETSVSLKAYTIFAAKMNLQNTPHGLDTLKFLLEDIDENPLTISKGKIKLAEIITETRSASAGIKTKTEARSASAGIKTQIEATSQKLITAGIKPNDRIAIQSENSADCAALILALWNIGAVAVPISTRYTPTQLKEAIEITSCKKIFGRLGSAHADLNIEVFNIEDFTNLNTSQIADLSFNDFNFNLESAASIIFTSASTAKPKAVLHTIANHYYSALGSNQNIPFAQCDAWLMSLPMYHISGLSLLMRSLLNKASIIFPKPDESIIDAIRNPEVTHISLVAAQLSTLLESNESLNRLKKFKAILIGGSEIPQSLIKQSIENFLPIFTSYGSTEMASQITTTAPGDLQTKIESSGKLLPHRNLKLTEDGEILVKGKTLFAGYVKKDSIDLPTDPQGYFHTNDIGSLDAESNLTVTGRKDLMFISGGENIHPQQIERQIEKISGVERAIVIPKDDKKFGKVAVAFIKMQKDTPLNTQAIQTELQKHLESFKIPKSIHPWPKQIPESIKPDRKSFAKFL
ncbi:MAG: o-succinylbenzoate--CoA ligase [Phycisphaerae bacterium]|nr:o-succinylbenzoate--CoA ligase [Phycisphaerae bacterium]